MVLVWLFFLRHIHHCLVPYPGLSLRESHASAEIQLAFNAAPADLAMHGHTHILEKEQQLSKDQRLGTISIQTSSTPEAFHLPTCKDIRKNSICLSSLNIYGPPQMAKEKQGDQFDPPYSSSVRIRDVTLKSS